MPVTKTPVSHRERQTAHTLMFILVLGWLALITIILLMRGASLGLGALLFMVLPFTVFLLLMVLSVIALGWGYFLLAQRRHARGLAVALFILAAVPLVLILWNFGSSVRSTDWKRSGRPYRAANSGRYDEVVAALDRPITLVDVHEYGECAVIEIEGGWGLVIDRRAEDRSVLSLEVLRQQFSGAEIRADLTVRSSFYPIETLIPELVEGDVFSFACGVWAGDKFYPAGLCPP